MLWLVTLLATQILGVALAVGCSSASCRRDSNSRDDLEFIPKLASVALVLFLVGPWMLTLLVDFTQQLFLKFPH